MPSPRRDVSRRRGPRARATVALVSAAALIAVALAGCTSTPGATSSAAAPPTSEAPTATGTPAATATASATATAASNGTPEPFRGEMTPQIQVIDGYVSLYITLRNTGSEALTFINTLYDTEPDQLWMPQVTIPFAAGGDALVTRAGRFFPSPAIVQPGDQAVYVMGGQYLVGGQPPGGVQALTEPATNIKFCPTRGMDDTPGVPLEVKDVTWSESDGVATVRGTLVETQGSRRPNLPMVGAAFFDAAGAFVGAVVDARAGDRMAPYSQRPFEISGRGVDTARIARVEAYAVIQ